MHHYFQNRPDWSTHGHLISAFSLRELLSGQIGTTGVLLTGSVFPTSTHFCISFPLPHMSSSTATRSNLNSTSYFPSCLSRLCWVLRTRTQSEGAVFLLCHTTPRLAQGNCQKIHVGLNMSVIKHCNPLLTRGALILWTLKSIKTHCTEASQCGTMTLLKKLLHFPHFSHCPEGGLVSPQNHLECIQGLWAHCLQFSNWHFTVIGPQGGSLKTCWKWWNFPVVEKKANNSGTCHSCRCPYKKLLRIELPVRIFQVTFFWR